MAPTTETRSKLECALIVFTYSRNSLIEKYITNKDRKKLNRRTSLDIIDFIEKFIKWGLELRRLTVGC